MATDTGDTDTQDEKLEGLTVREGIKHILEARGGTVLQSDLTSQFGYNGSHVSRTLSKMEDDGLVSKEDHPEDRRINRIVLVEEESSDSRDQSFVSGRGIEVGTGDAPDYEKVSDTFTHLAGEENTLEKKTARAVESEIEEALGELPNRDFFGVLSSPTSVQVLFHLSDYESSGEMAEELDVEKQEIEYLVNQLGDIGVINNKIEFPYALKFSTDEEVYDKLMQVVKTVENVEEMVPGNDEYGYDYERLMSTTEEPSNLESWIEAFDTVVGPLDQEEVDETYGGELDGQTLEPRGKGPEIDADTVFGILSNSRRRLALEYIIEKIAEGDEEVVSKRDLAENVAARENGKTVNGITSDERNRAYISLHQVHLKELDRANWISYDKKRGKISLPEGHETLPDEVVDFLEFDENIDLEYDKDETMENTYLSFKGGEGPITGLLRRFDLDLDYSIEVGQNSR